MKRFALALLLVLAACEKPGPPPPADTSIAETHGRQNGDYYDYLSLGEMNVFEKSAGRARREGAMLTLSLSGGKTKTLQTRDDCAGPASKDCTIYSLMAVWPSRQAYLVHKGYYQSGDFLLIDDRDGRETVLSGLPIFGPDRTRFVVLTGDGPDRKANIEVYVIAKDRPVREWSAGKIDVPTMWRSLHFLGWDRDGITIEVRGTVSDSAAQRAEKILVSRDDSGWGLATPEERK